MKVQFAVRTRIAFSASAQMILLNLCNEIYARDAWNLCGFGSVVNVEANSINLFSLCLSPVIGGNNIVHNCLRSYWNQIIGHDVKIQKLRTFANSLPISLIAD